MHFNCKISRFDYNPSKKFATITLLPPPQFCPSYQCSDLFEVLLESFGSDQLEPDQQFPLECVLINGTEKQEKLHLLFGGRGGEL